MAKKLVGRVGFDLIKPVVTENGEKGLPVSRPSRKYNLAKQLFERCIAVDFEGINVAVSVPSTDEFYRILHCWGYKWNGEKWYRTYPNWVKVEV